MPSNSIRTASFYLNKNGEKSSYDQIKITANEEGFTTCFYDNKSKTMQETGDLCWVLCYVRDILYLLQNDVDQNSYASLDIMIPGYPIVCLDISTLQQDLVLRVLDRWLLSTLHKE